MLANMWVLPALMVAAFVIILFFGKRLPQGGWWVGQLAITVCFVLSIVGGVQWQNTAKVAVVHHEAGAEGEGHSAEGAAEGEGHSAEGAVEGASADGAHAEGETHTEAPAEGEVSAEARAAVQASTGRGFSITAAEEEGPAMLRSPVRNIKTWFSDGNVDVTVGTHVDGFALAMLFVVCFISFCVHIFSREYLRGDIRFTHYYASLALFTGAMLWMVQSATTLGLLFGWEMMGLCSFLLIGHWWEDQNNTNAALKAFFTTRTGDIGLLIGIIILFFASGQTFDIAKTNEMALNDGISQKTLLLAAVCLFCGVVGKSAQFPLHTWLPDAMAGPTPASSLIHAATMVVAGVYLVGRMYGVFFKGFSIAAGGMNLGAWVGSITLVSAALLAFVQTDIKKVLAYSTVSQLGYMIMGLSVGAWAGALFHLFTHAFFKALLFQGAGSIAHSGSHHSFEMDRMGGLRKFMPWTFGTFTVGYLALCGLPPFSGFFSKDEILSHAKYNGFGFAFAAGSVGAFLTACYMTRVMYKTFFGENRLHLHHDDHDVHDAHDAVGHDAHAVSGHDTHDTHDTHDSHAPVHALAAVAHGGHDDHSLHAVAVGHHAHNAHDAHDAGHDSGHDAHDSHDGPHESNWWILGPLVLLAIPAFMVGIAQWPFGGIPKFAFEHFTEDVVFEETILKNKMLIPFKWDVAIPSIGLALAGIAVSLAYYLGAKGDLGLVRKFAPARWIHNLLKNKYYLDHLWTEVIVGSIKGPIAATAYWINQNVLDGVVNTAGKGATAVGRFAYEVIDQKVVDGVVNGSGSIARESGGVLRLIQTGKVQNYAAVVLGFVGLIGLGLALFI
jgi:NADH-quinone oxidoreductase subunit L